MTTKTGIGPLIQLMQPVSDVDRAVGFYRDTLGMKLLFQVEGQPMAFFDMGGTRLYVGVPEGADLKPGTGSILYFRVGSAREMYETLQQRGLKFDDRPHVVHRAGGVELWTAFFKDPDGNLLAIMSEEAEGTETGGS